MENTLNVAAAASFSEASTIDFEIEYLLIRNEPPCETNYNAIEAILTNNATAPCQPTKDTIHN